MSQSSSQSKVCSLSCSKQSNFCCSSLFFSSSCFSRKRSLIVWIFFCHRCVASSVFGSIVISYSRVRKTSFHWQKVNHRKLEWVCFWLNIYKWRKWWIFGMCWGCSNWGVTKFWVRSWDVLGWRVEMFKSWRVEFDPRISRIFSSESASGYFAELWEIEMFKDYTSFLDGWFFVVGYSAALRAGYLLHCVTTGLRLRLITCCPPDKLPVFMSDDAIGWAEMVGSWKVLCFGLKSWRIGESTSQKVDESKYWVGGSANDANFRERGNTD